MRRFWVFFVVLAVIGAASCHKVDSNAAIQAAVENHLRRNSHLMLNSFTTHFEKVSQNGDTAQAMVKYQSKNLPKVAVEESYGLKKIDGQWQVVSSSSASGQMTNPGNPHQSLDQESSPGAAAPGVPSAVASH